MKPSLSWSFRGLSPLLLVDGWHIPGLCQSSQELVEDKIKISYLQLIGRPTTHFFNQTNGCCRLLSQKFLITSVWCDYHFQMRLGIILKLLILGSFSDNFSNWTSQLDCEYFPEVWNRKETESGLPSNGIFATKKTWDSVPTRLTSPPSPLHVHWDTTN